MVGRNDNYLDCPKKEGYILSLKMIRNRDSSRFLEMDQSPRLERRKRWKK